MADLGKVSRDATLDLEAAVEHLFKVAKEAGCFVSPKIKRGCAPPLYIPGLLAAEDIQEGEEPGWFLLWYWAAESYVTGLREGGGATDFAYHPFRLAAFNPGGTREAMRPSQEAEYFIEMATDLMMLHESMVRCGQEAGVPDSVEAEMFLRARLCSQTRVFQTCVDTTLVPVADLLNHSPTLTPGVLWAWDGEAQCMVITAVRAHRSGEELFTTYGSRPREDLPPTPAAEVPDPPLAQPTRAPAPQGASSSNLDEGPVRVPQQYSCKDSMTLAAPRCRQMCIRQEPLMYFLLPSRLVCLRLWTKSEMGSYATNVVDAMLAIVHKQRMNIHRRDTPQGQCQILEQLHAEGDRTRAMHLSLATVLALELLKGGTSRLARATRQEMRQSNMLLYRTYGFTLHPKEEPSFTYIIRPHIVRPVMKVFWGHEEAKPLMLLESSHIDDSLCKARLPVYRYEDWAQDLGQMGWP
eukprot:s2248_g1.t3